MRKFLCLLIIVSLAFFGCANMKTDNPMTLEEQLSEAQEIGYLAGVEFKRTQTDDNVAKAALYTNRILLGTNVIATEDLIDAGIKLYLQSNPEAGLYYMVAKRALRLLNLKLPSINVLETKGIKEKLGELNPELVNAFLKGFLDGLTGKVAMKADSVRMVKPNGQVVFVSPNQQRAMKGD